MPFVRIRLTGSSAAATAMVAVLHGVIRGEHVEEVADLMPHMDDPDSSSAGLPDDTGPGMHAIEIEARDAVEAERVRRVAEDAAEAWDVAIEFVDAF